MTYVTFEPVGARGGNRTWYMKCTKLTFHRILILSFRFYQITNRFTGGCDFGLYQHETKRLLLDQPVQTAQFASIGTTSTLINWDRIRRPVVACFLPQRFCDDTSFRSRLTALLVPNSFYIIINNRVLSPYLHPQQ